MTIQVEATSTAWFSSGISTRSSRSESEAMLMQSFFSGHGAGGGGNENGTQFTSVPPSSPSSSTVTSTPEDERTIKPQFPPPIDKTNPDFTLPVSKFLEGFRVQAAASLSNAYQ
jgi:hypothetical protein